MHILSALNRREPKVPWSPPTASSRVVGPAESSLMNLVAVARHHGIATDVAALRRRFVPVWRELRADDLLTIADRIGLPGRSREVAAVQLGSLQLPALLHWRDGRFVVLGKLRFGKALVSLGGEGERWYRLSDLHDHCTGLALEFLPATDFTVEQRKVRLTLSQLWSSLVGLKRAMLQIFILTLVLKVFILASPYYMQLAIDRVVAARDVPLLQVLALGFGLFVLIEAASRTLRAYVLLWAGSSLGYGLSVNLARHLFRLPTSWFEQRHVGDILSRFQSVKPIQDLLLTGAVATLIDGAMASVTLVVMFVYSPLLTALALLAFILYMLAKFVSFSAERRATEAAISAGAAEQSNMIENIRGISTVRMFAQETMRHALWQGKLSEKVSADVRVEKVKIWQTTANGLLFGLENIVMVYVAIGLVLSGGFSIGMVFAYIAYKTQFTTKAASFIDQIFYVRMLNLHLERISDIALSDEDVSFGIHADTESELRGEIELRDVSYRYSPDLPFVLNRLDLRVAAGEHVAITGPSGCGKSTVVKVLLGLVEPQGGEFLVEGLPIARFGHRSYHRQVAAVLQDDVLFAGSLADNIALFETDPDPVWIEACGRMAAIHDDIMAMPLQYGTPVGDMGAALSGGQKQRVLLARALYRRPKVLVMDEGTAHLDLEHERLVNEAVGSLGITRIIIAHRHETIASADRILVMRNGQIQADSADPATGRALTEVMQPPLPAIE